jgi:nucleoporin NUP159
MICINLILPVVSSITWLENDVFMMVHNPSNIDSDKAPTSLFHLVTRLPKSSEHIYQKLADPAPNFGLNRSPPHHFLLRLRDFPPNLKDLIIVSSTASTDIGLFTRSAVPLVSDKPADEVTGVFTMTEMSDDSRRAQLPVNEAVEDTSPIGAVLDLSAREKVARPIPSDEMDESRTPLPALLVLNNEGVLASWWVVYSESVRQGTSYPGLVAAASSQSGTTVQPLSSNKSLPSVPSSHHPIFGSSSNMGSAFGTTNKPAPGFSSGGAFGGQSDQPSSWPNASTGPAATTGASSFGSSTAPAFGGPTFGTPAFGISASPTTAGVAFGNSALPGTRPSPWSAAGSGAPASTFGQPSGLGVAGTPGLGNAKPPGSVFSSGLSSIAPTTGGFASFASKGGFAAMSTPQNSKENTFATKSDSTSFSLSPKIVSSSSDFGFNGGTAPTTRGDPFSSQGFTLASTFKPDDSHKDDGPRPENVGSNSFFGSGFGKFLGEAQMSPVISSPEATMDDTTDLGQESTPVPKDNATEPMGSTEEDRSQLPGTEATKAAPKLHFPTAQSRASVVREPTPKSTDTMSLNPQTIDSTGFSFEAPPAATQLKDSVGRAKEFASVPSPIHNAPQDANIKQTLQSSDVGPNLPEIAKTPRPSVFAPPKSQQIGDVHVSAEEQPAAPLPPDFISVLKPTGTETLDLDRPQSIKNSSFRAVIQPPLHVPPSSEEGHSSDYSDGGDQSFSDDEEKSGEDIANDIGIPSGNTPDLTPESSFGRSNYTNRGNASFAAGPMSSHQSTSRSLFGEIGDRISPVLPPPKPGSPRSPSPIRSSVPARLLGRPDVSRSVSAPIAASKLLGVRAAPISSNAFGHSGGYGEEEARRRTEALKKKEAEESQALVDVEDDRMQDFLSRDVEGTTRLDEFVAHQDYVGGADKDSIPFQVEAVYRDINSMIDTLGVNSHTVKSFTKGHTENYKDPGRERADLEGVETWCLGEIENLSSIIEKDLSKELQQGRIKDVVNKLQLCSIFVKELVKLRARTEDALIVVTSSCGQDHKNVNKSQPLTAEQVAQQHDLRKDLANFQKLLGDAEEELILLRAKIASFTGSNGKPGPGPTTEAVMRTINKMTAMAEKRSGDVDVIENQMRKLRFSSVASNERNSPEGSPFTSPTKPTKRHNTAFALSGRPYTPDGTQKGFSTLHMSLSSSIRSQNHSTPPRKKLDGFTEEDKSTIKCSFSRKKEVTDRLKGALEKSKTKVRLMGDE